MPIPDKTEDQARYPFPPPPAKVIDTVGVHLTEDERRHLLNLCRELELREESAVRRSEGPEAETLAAERAALSRLMLLPGRAAKTEFPTDPSGLLTAFVEAIGDANQAVAVAVGQVGATAVVVTRGTMASFGVNPTTARIDVRTSVGIVKIITEGKAGQSISLRRAALEAILDAVDYTDGSCAATEPVGAVLPKVLIERAREALK